MARGGLPRRGGRPGSPSMMLELSASSTSRGRHFPRPSRSGLRHDGPGIPRPRSEALVRWSPPRSHPGKLHPRPHLRERAQGGCAVPGIPTQHLTAGRVAQQTGLGGCSPPPSPEVPRGNDLLPFTQRASSAAHNARSAPTQPNHWACDGRPERSWRGELACLASIQALGAAFMRGHVQMQNGKTGDQPRL
jgi:hypothetical protein